MIWAVLQQVGGQAANLINFLLLAAIRQRMEHTNHLEAHAVDGDIVAQRPLILAEQLTLHAGADDCDFCPQYLLLPIL